jgi:O-antigen/teichoic acid export membrane protein
VADRDDGPRVNPAGAGRNTLLAFLTQLATGAFTAFITIYLVRTLGPADFGLFSLAVSIAALVMLPSDFGISGSASRFIAERFGDWRAVAVLMSDALRLKLVVSGLVSLVLIVLAGPIAEAYGEPELAWPIRWMAFAVLFQGLVGFYRYAFLAMRDAGVGFRIVVGESAIEAGATVLLVTLAGGAASASAGRAVGYAFGTALAVAITLKRLGLLAFTRSGRIGEARRKLARYAGALFAIDAAFSASVNMAPLMIGGFLGSREVGLFSAPSRLIVLLQYPGVAVANSVSPLMSRGENHEPNVPLYTNALRYLIVLQALLVAPIVVWADPIVDLVLGDGYERSADLLRELGPYIFVAGLSGVLAGGLNYLGEAKRRVPIAIGDVILTAALTAGGLATIGLSGAAYAADLVSVLYALVHIWILRILVQLPVGKLALSLARSLAAGAAMAGVMLLFGSEDLAVWEWFAGGAAGLAAFVVVIVASGEVSLAQLRALPRTVRERARR